MKILMITSEWPSEKNPNAVPFLVRQVRFLREKGIEIDIYSFKGKKNPINYLRFWVSVQKLLRKRKYTLIHAQFGQSALLAFPKKIPVVITFHGSDLEGIINKDGRYTMWGRILSKSGAFLSTKATKVIVVSKSLLRHLPSHKNVVIIPCGIDLSLFKPMDQNFCRRVLNWDINEKVVLFAGSADRIVKRFWLAKAAVDLLNQHFPIRLVEMSEISHERIPLYINGCDCLLLTSYHEGSPNVIKEALACNKPIVSVNVGDVEERIKNIPGSYLCRDVSPEEISNGLRQVLKNPVYLESRHHMELLDENFTTQKIIELYNEIAPHETHQVPEKELTHF